MQPIPKPTIPLTDLNAVSKELVQLLAEHNQGDSAFKRVVVVKIHVDKPQQASLCISMREDVGKEQESAIRAQVGQYIKNRYGVEGFENLSFEHGRDRGRELAD